MRLEVLMFLLYILFEKISCQVWKKTQLIRIKNYPILSHKHEGTQAAKPEVSLHGENFVCG